MTVCLVTDRHRLAAAGGAGGDWGARLRRQIADAAEAGVDLVQIREPDLPAGELCRLVADAVILTRGTATRVVVNDRLDVALAAGADGVHLRSGSFAASRARALAPLGFLVGRSVHGADEARAAAEQGCVDYLIAGTVFPSRSKAAGSTSIGVPGLADVVMAAHVPILAIGGITLETAPDAARAGAAGVAAIGFFILPGGATAGLAGPVEALRRVFDSSRPNP
jgi:thiamine-phosphate pyrophosphorylase